MNMPKNQINFVDLFCGAGGLSRGLEMAGFKCILATDNDKAAMSTFERNHPDAEACLGDISDISNYKFRKISKAQKIHIVCGGPPCQGLSTVGEGIPDDPRNFLFLEFVRAVKNIKPEFVILENVTGILGKKNIKITAGIISQFVKMGYNMEVRVLSSDHFGVPQRRRRSIFIGNKLGLETYFPKPTHAGHPTTVNNAFYDMKFDGIEHNHDLEAAEIKNEIEKQRIDCIPEGKSVRYQKDEEEYLPDKLRFDVDWDKVDEHRFREKKLNRLDGKKPAPTIMTGRYTYYHPTEPRHITAREAAVLQSFPNDFIFDGTVSQQWRQIGNAVPVLLGKAIGISILKTYREQKKLQPTSYGSVEELIAAVRAHAFDYKKLDSEKQIRNTNL